MDVFPKFIIETDEQEGDCLIIAKCTYHKQLATDIGKVKGGGWWTFDKESSTFTLHGDSHDFGKASIDNIAKCVQSKKVFSNASLIKNLTDGHKFNYRNEVGEIYCLETYITEQDIFKCDKCQFKKRHTTGTDEYPAYTTIEYCSKGHWECGDIGSADDIDKWSNCEDFLPCK